MTVIQTPARIFPFFTKINIKLFFWFTNAAIVNYHQHQKLQKLQDQ